MCEGDTSSSCPEHWTAVCIKPTEAGGEMTGTIGNEDSVEIRVATF